MARPRIKIGDAFDRAIGVTDALEVQEWFPTVVDDIIHPHFLEKAKENLDSQGQLVGERWNFDGEPLYAAWKQKKVGHTDVLRWRKGSKERLYPSLTDPTNPWHYFRQTKTTVAIGTSVPYAPRLQKGGEGPFGEPYPGRQFLPSSTKASTALATEIQRHLKRHINRVGLRIGDVRSNVRSDYRGRAAA
jgi:phage gpG-like protein